MHTQQAGLGIFFVSEACRLRRGGGGGATIHLRDMAYTFARRIVCATTYKLKYQQTCVILELIYELSLSKIHDDVYNGLLRFHRLLTSRL